MLVLGLLVVGIYFTRLTYTPVCGEESRWATAAREMIASGDWIVPRQQGTIFPERPPLGSWAMAVVGLAVGEVDLLAIRLPSACATLLLTWLIYAYARTWTSRLTSFAAAVVYATFGQVLPLGRFGESEALFTLLLGGALLVWHAGYLSGRSPAATWSAGYTLAGLGALVKGPQAPVYFVAVCGIYLALNRQWRWLFCRGHALGALCFAAVVGVWMVPFCWSNLYATDDIWAGLARDRFTTDGLLRHLVTFPFETFGCLLPWSPLLVLFVRPAVRRAIFTQHPQAWFLVVAIVVTYPSVWVAAYARGRYFMPLYPCVAMLIALVVEHCTAAAADTSARLFWRRYQRGLGIVGAAAGALMVVAYGLPLDALRSVQQSLAESIGFALAAAVAAAAMFWTSRDERGLRPQWALAIVATFVGLAYTGLVLDARRLAGNDLEPVLADIKDQMPNPEGMVSLGRVYHRFAYSYSQPIRQVPWPHEAGELPADAEYFCYDLRPGYFDPPARGAGDGQVHAGTTAPLPFEWEKVTEIGCDPVKRKSPHTTVVIGRIRRPMLAADPTNQPVRR